LAAVAPGLGRASEREYGSDEVARAALDLVRFLAPPPAVVVFEDLHEADPESVGLFVRLAMTADLGAAVVGTYRPDDVTPAHPLARMVAGLERRRSIVHIALGRLSRNAVGELLSSVYAARVPWHATDAVYRRTDGNPFFVEEVLLAAAEADPEQLATAALPATVTDVVKHHLDALSEMDREVIEAAAVLGSRFSFDLLSTFVGLDEKGIIPILRRLVRGGLLNEERADVLSFRHALTQEVVAGQLLARQRRRLHEQALRAMNELDSDDYAALAHHATAAGKVEEAVVYCRRGGAEYLRMGLSYESLRLAELGLTFVPDDIELRRVASQAAWRIGLLDVARAHGLDWSQLARDARNPTSEGAALRHLARVEWEAGHAAAGTAFAEQSLKIAEQDVPGEELALSMVLMSEVRMLTLIYEPSAGPPNVTAADEAVHWADQALAIADRLGLPHVRPRALVNKGSALTCRAGGTTEGMLILERARRESADREDAWNHMRALRNMIDIGLTIWPLDRIQAALEEEREVGRRIGREGPADHNWALDAADLSVLRGDQSGARAYLSEGRRLTPDMLGYERWRYAASEIRLALEAGELADAARQLAQAEESGGWSACFDAIAAELAALQDGDPRIAANRLMVAVDGVDSGTIPAARRRPVLIAIITLLRRGGEPAPLRAVVDRLDEAWPAWPDDPSTNRRHAEAALLEAEDQLSDAMAAYRDVIDDPHARQPVYLIADAEQGLARCLLRTGNAADARTHSQRAIVLLERWPGWRAAQAEALIRRCRARDPVDRTPRDRHAAPSTGAVGVGDGPLTAREREIAALLTRGLTNGQIARRLVISTKTVSVHVSHILAKLGMATRTEVAAWAMREGIE
jgi:DNA-binding CsgD family transcriptional regulator/tetratricopeptide (TPR) repeat protein